VTLTLGERLALITATMVVSCGRRTSPTGVINYRFAASRNDCCSSRLNTSVELTTLTGIR